MNGLSSEHETPPASRGGLLADVALAFAFLTRLPPPAPHDGGGRALARSVWAWPLAGAAVGGIAGLVLWGASGMSLHPLACAFLAICAQVWLTGALHEDGLADTADGFGASARERRLEIMRDSRIGAYGVLALIFSVGVRASLLASMPGPGSALLVMTAAGALSRSCMAAPMWMMNPARPDGLGAGAGKPRGRSVLTGLGLAAVITAAATLWLGGDPLAEGLQLNFLVLWAPAAALAGAVLTQALAARKLGGYTGDTLGATQQAAEIAFLFALSGALN